MSGSRYGAPALVAVCLAATLSSCGADKAQEPAAAGTPSSGQEGTLPQGSEPAKLDPADFSTEIDNTYWPMKPGQQWSYRETDAEGQVTLGTVTVTSGTRKLANGVVARVVRDTATRHGEIVEDTFDWYAQDSEGTVWYLGEDTAEFEKGKPPNTDGSFEAGKDGALGGVIMPGQPTQGMTYRQEYLQGEAEDNGAVLGVDAMADVVAGHYDRAVLTSDTSGIEPDVMELKFYAPGVGPVLALGVSGDIAREELTGTSTVTPEVASAAASTPLGRPYG